MAKIDSIYMADIIVKIVNELGIKLTPDDIYVIGSYNSRKKVTSTYINSEGKSIWEEAGTLDMNKTCDDKECLMRFLIKHQEEIDRVHFVTVAINRLMEEIEKRESLREGCISSICLQEVKEEEKSKQATEIQKERKALSELEGLLAGIDYRCAFSDLDEQTKRYRIKRIIRANKVKSEKSNKEKQSRLDRIDDNDLRRILSVLDPKDILYGITCEAIGSEFLSVAVFNTVLNENPNLNPISEDIKVFELCKAKKIEMYTEENVEKCVDEILQIVREFVQDVNLDGLLLCAAHRGLKACENGIDIPGNYETLQIIVKHLREKSKFLIPKDKKEIDTRKVKSSMKLFIDTGKEIRYVPLSKIEELREKVKKGEVALNDIASQVFTGEELEDIRKNSPDLLPKISLQLFRAIGYSKYEMAELGSRDTDNYIFLFQEDTYNAEKNEILKNIYETRKCSIELLKLLCEKKYITVDEVRGLFEHGIITVGDLREVREQVGIIITDDMLFKKYLEYKELRELDEESDETKKAREQLEKYALVYTKIELTHGEKTENKEEIAKKRVERATELIEKNLDQIGILDLIFLYKLDVIPFEVIIEYGENEIAIELLKNEALKKAHIIYLREKGILTEDFVKKLFTNDCPDMSYAYQLLVIGSAFDRNTEEGKETRERLQQFLHIIPGISVSKAKNLQKTTNSTSDQNLDATPEINHIEKEETIEMGRSPWAKMELLNAIDKGVRVEAGIKDGHMIFHLPNIGEGIVIIEKLHNISKDRKTGKKKVTVDNESATYIMTEQEFIEMKDKLINNGCINRRELTGRWYDRRIKGNPDPKHWIPHVSVAGWEMKLIEYFNINEGNPFYSKEDIEEIKSLMLASIESKKKEYKPEHLERIERILTEKMQCKDDGVR